MKLEAGIYVRTNKGIFQIRNKNVFIEDKKQYIGVNGRYTCIDIEKIEKASHKIIDILEVGDYVNGRLVEWKSEDFVTFGRLDYAYEKDIKSIVTKEQFEVMSYKVVE